jgi:hypothetical protein
MASTVTITSATLDKASYATGDTMTLTIVRSATATTEAALNLAVNATGADGTQATPINVTATIEVTSPEASTVGVTDDSGRQWAQASDDGTTAVWTATA